MTERVIKQAGESAEEARGRQRRERTLTFDEYAREYAKQLADQLGPVDDHTAARWARVLGRKR